MRPSPTDAGAFERVHFWTDDGVDLDGWAPDRQPERFADAFGHGFLELFVRLRARGLPVTLGSRPPSGTRLLVVDLGEITSWDGGYRPGRVLRLAPLAVRAGGVVVIRNDRPLQVASPRFVRSEVMPSSQACAGRVGARWLPLLPRRGLVRRAPSRRGRVESLVLKAYPSNVPEYVSDPGFRQQLDDLGVELRVDVHPAAWPDFRDADVTLCDRRLHCAIDGDHVARKPPTKLINAWSAGSIPLVFPEAAYLALVRDGSDALIVDSPEAVVDALQRLRDDRQLLTALEEGVRMRMVEFEVDRVLDRWVELLWQERHRIAPPHAVACEVVGIAWSVLRVRCRRTLARTLRALVSGRRSVPSRRTGDLRSDEPQAGGSCG